ncbi:magnesium transporter, partial [Vogesella mureinivorans]
LWFGDAALSGVIFAALVINLTAASLAGVAVPLTLKRLGFDPALASSIFLTTVTDVFGFFAFLGLGTLILL